MIKHIVSVFIVWACAFMSLSLISGCVNKYKAAPNLVDLQVSLADPSWDGKRVPDGQQCGKFGGKGSTPRITVSNIPAGCNAIVMEFSDADVSHMDNGGHGKIGYYIPKGADRVVIPPVPGHTFDLPEGFYKVAAHVNPGWDEAGAYLPPCSGGRGNSYYVTVKAVYEAPKGEQCQMLGKAKLKLGRY